MYQRILVPVDGSPTSDRGLDEAILLGVMTHASLRLIHVVDGLPFLLSAGTQAPFAADLPILLRERGEAVLKEAMAKVDAAGIEVDTVLRDSSEGAVCELVAAEARGWHADLIVIGTHGRRGLERTFLGSDAEQISRTAPVPVLLVRARP